MRLRTLTLERFGRFTDRKFDFGEVCDAPDFHVIYGPNEAGKTTLTEGVMRLFFGFKPGKEPYAFQHDRETLSVAAEIEDHGPPRYFRRSPKKGSPLLDEHGNPLPGQFPSSLLGQFDEERYRKLFCLDDETIESGGDEIAKAKGAIGSLLFSATSGVASLSTVLDGIQESASGIWKKRSPSTRVAALKAEIKDIEARLKTSYVSAAEFNRLRSSLAKATNAVVEAKDKVGKLESRARQIATDLDAIPLLQEVKELEIQLAPISEYPDELTFDQDNLLELLRRETLAQEGIKRRIAEAEEARSKRDAITPRPDLVELADELDVIEDLRKDYRSAIRDIPRRRSEIRDIEEKMRMLSSQIDPSYREAKGKTREGGPSADAPDALVLDQSSIRRLQESLEALRDARNELKHAERELAEAKERLLAGKMEHDRVVGEGSGSNPPTGDRGEIAQPQKRVGEKTARLRPGAPSSDRVAAGSQASESTAEEILKRYGSDQLVAANAIAVHVIESREAELRDALESLARGSVSFESVPRCKTTIAQAEEWLSGYQRAVLKIEKLEEELGTEKKLLAEQEAEIGCLTTGSTVVPDEEANRLKEERDQLWKAHRKGLSIETARPFEKAMHRVDEAASARVANASELGRLRVLEDEHAKRSARLEEIRAQIAAAGDSRSGLAAEVDAAAAAIGLPIPMSPEDWAEWTRSLDAAGKINRALEKTRAEHADTFERSDALLEALRSLVGSDSLDLDQAIEIAKSMAETERRHAEAAQRAKRDLSSLSDDCMLRTSREEKFRADTEAAANEWQNLVSQLLGDLVDPDRLMDSLDLLVQLQAEDGKRKDLLDRVAKMERDRNEFALATKRLACKHVPDLPVSEKTDSGARKDKNLEEGNELSPDETFDRLREMSATARREHDERGRHDLVVSEAEESAESYERELESVRAEAKVIGRLFPDDVPTDTLEDLGKAIEIANRAGNIRGQIRNHEEALRKSMSGSDRGAIQARLEGTDVDELRVEESAVTADLEAATRERDEAIGSHAKAEQSLESITDDATSAELAQRKELLYLEMEEAARKYLQIQFGLELAEEAIRRYRAENRSEMLKATDKAFSMLTDGAYNRLVTVVDKKGEILIAICADGSSRKVAELSKGTRFQLYLALRAAAHEHLIEQGLNLPFIGDDVFETFDEERTRAACRVMEKIGQTGQAIYLTHHKHVVDIAREACNSEPTIHELL